MHDSGINSKGNKLMPALIAVSVLSVMALGGLGVYTWQLGQQLSSLQAQQTEQQPSRPSLFDRPQAPSIFGQASTDPFQQMEVMRQQMDTMMESFFNGSGSGSRPSITGIPGISNNPGDSLFGDNPFAGIGLNQPAIALRETGQTLEVVIPVLEGQEFELNTDVQQDRLTVSGTMSWQSNDSTNGISSTSRGSRQFSRSIALPDNVDPAGMVTEHRGSEIVISLPKV